jgi:hypothetical protein
VNLTSILIAAPIDSSIALFAIVHSFDTPSQQGVEPETLAS